MVYDVDERSAASGAPIELYRFVGTYNTYRLTSHAVDITNTEGTYTAEAIKRDKVKSGSQDDSDQKLTISLPFVHPMVSEYVFLTSPPTLFLTLFRAHASDLNDTIGMVWRGCFVEC